VTNGASGPSVVVELELLVTVGNGSVGTLVEDGPTTEDVELRPSIEDEETVEVVALRLSNEDDGTIEVVILSSWPLIEEDEPHVPFPLLI
jgi:hypothetical protein